MSLFTLVDLDNKTPIGTKELGKSNLFSFDGTLFYFGSMHSSRVQSIAATATGFVVQTRNSKYTFEEVSNQTTK